MIVHAAPADRWQSVRAEHVGSSATLIASRLTIETILRGVDLLYELAEGNIAHGMIVSALWCFRLSETVAPRTSLILPRTWKESGSIHGLARALEMPYPTVHRHLTALARRGMAVRNPAGRFTISSGLVDSRAGQSFCSRSLASASRFIVGLHRIGGVSGDITAFQRDGGLSIGQQDAVFRAHMEIVLVNLQLTARSYGDLMVGLVFNFVATANIKHLTEMPAGTSGFLPDEMRCPISVYRVAKSLHVPYETVRRITRRLLDQDVFEQVGDQGVIVPARSLRASVDPAIAVESDRSIADSFRQIRLAGVPISFSAER
jgi:IclR-like helix-turn-helix domain-containing protein